MVGGEKSLTRGMGVETPFFFFLLSGGGGGRRPLTPSLQRSMPALLCMKREKGKERGKEKEGEGRCPKGAVLGEWPLKTSA